MKKLSLFLVVLAGCTMYPKYERPTFTTDNKWRDPLGTTNSVDVGWWEQFGDKSLDDLIHQALKNNQDIRSAIAKVEAFGAELTITKSQMFPQVSTDIISSRQKIAKSVTALPTGIKPVFNLFGLLLKAAYVVDLWGEIRSGVDAAYHTWLSAIEARRSIVLGIVTSVASSYVQLRQIDQQLLISKETLRAREESYYLAKVRYDLGLTSEIEVEQAISEVEEAKMEVENFEIMIAETENQLSFLVGCPCFSIPRGATLDTLLMPPSIPPFLPSDLLENRPDVRAAEERLIALNANIGVAKAQFFPKINFNSAVGAESTKLNTLFTDQSKTWSFGSDILQQIFTGFALTGGLELARAQMQDALHSYLSTVLKAFQEANDAITSHKIYLEEVETQRRRVDALRQYLHLADLRYKEGQTDYLTYLDAERHLFAGLLDLETAKGNSFLSYVQIYQAFGGGWVTAADDTATNCCEN